MPAAASPPVGSPPQYSPALRWVTTGFGMGPGGASTLSATGTPHPPQPEGRSALLRQGRGKRSPRSCPLARAPCPATSAAPPGTRLAAAGQPPWSGTAPGGVSPSWEGSPPRGEGRSALPLARAAPLSGHDTGSEYDAGDPPSTIRTARLQSVARGPPAAYQPGHLPGVLPP